MNDGTFEEYLKEQQTNDDIRSRFIKNEMSFDDYLGFLMLDERDIKGPNGVTPAKKKETTPATTAEVAGPAKTEKVEDVDGKYASLYPTTEGKTFTSPNLNSIYSLKATEEGKTEADLDTFTTYLKDIVSNASIDKYYRDKYGDKYMQKILEMNSEEDVEKGEYVQYILPTKNKRSKTTVGRPGTNEALGILLHHTGEGSDLDMLKILTGATKRLVSSHAFIGKDGSRYILGNPEDITYHAGLSRMEGKDNTNLFTVGIEFAGDTNKAPLTQDQINSGVEYIYDIAKNHNIPIERIMSHQDVRTNYKKAHPNNKEAYDKVDISEGEMNRMLDILNKSLYLTPVVSNMLNK